MMRVYIFISLIASGLLAEEEPYQIKLLELLDRPKDGYCLDVAGSGKFIRTDLPLIGHNCKPGLYPDEAFVFEDDGTIYFPESDLCVTISGVNEYVLDYTSLSLRECFEDTPFLNAAFMQDFEYTKDKKIKHKHSSKCLEVGEESSMTYSEKHTWRTLYMKECSQTEAKRSTWHFYKPKL